jgi:hypothetical protein
MDVMAILTLIAKGVSIVEMAIEAGKNAAPAIEIVKNLITGAKTGTMTQEELDSIEAQLDAAIDEFNEPIPD